MSMLTRLFNKMLTPNRHDRVVNELTYVRCYDCGLKFWAFDEGSAALQLSKHSILTHTEPPAEEETPPEDSFRSEIRDRLYGAR